MEMLITDWVQCEGSRHVPTQGYVESLESIRSLEKQQLHDGVPGKNKQKTKQTTIQTQQ